MDYEAWTTESTDDAYVNSYPTYVAPRVSGQVLDDGVKVKDNNHVHQGDLLVQLDPEPYQVQVNLKKAFLTQTEADLVATQDQVRGQVALARSNRFKLEHTIENVDNQIAQLHVNVATWDATKARQDRAQKDYDRAKDLSKTPGAISQQDLDLKLQDVRVADSQVKQALETVYQTRVSLGLPTKPEKGIVLKQALPGVATGGLVVVAQSDLTYVRPNLNQTFSTVRQAVAELLQSAAPLGIFPSSYDLMPKQILEEFYKRDPQGNVDRSVAAAVGVAFTAFYQRDPQEDVVRALATYAVARLPSRSAHAIPKAPVDRIYAQILKDAPAIKQAEAKVQEAEHDLEQAKLNLRYCNVYAEIDGVITRRNVNPGNNVQAGQNLMVIRPLKAIWVDANFKETQLRNLRIGQKVRIEVDMYGSHRTFHGRITGFTMGTGQTLSLLPPQNATGNYVTIRAAVIRVIELDDYDPDGRSSAVRRPLGRAVRLHQATAHRRRPGERGVASAVSAHQAGREGSQAMSVAALPLPGARPAINPWFIAAAVVIPAFMEVLDTTIANVALPYIAGGLATARTDGEWVITSYLAANAIVLPISGWLSAQLGRRNYFLLSIAVFTLASALCGMATSLTQIIIFRALQGLAGGGLQPSSQGVLIDSFPAEKQGLAQTLFGIAALIGPIVGPTLGGWLVVTYNWRYIFYINVPVGIFALVSCYFLVQDPDYLKQERAELRRRPLNFDYIGLGLLSLAIASWEVLLSKGQEWDWLGDPFWRIQTLTILFVGGGIALVIWEMRSDSPIINFRVLGERNLAMSCIIIFCAFLVLYCGSIALPALLQSLFGYDALASGLVLSPGGISSISALVVVGFLLGRGVDARWLIVAGLLVLATSNYWMAHMNLQDQSLAGDRAADGADRRPWLDLRADQPGSLQVYAQTAARRGGGPARPAPQRGRQRRHVADPDHPGTPRSIPHVAHRGISRPFERLRGFLPGPGPRPLRAG